MKKAVVTSYVRPSTKIQLECLALVSDQTHSEWVGRSIERAYTSAFQDHPPNQMLEQLLNMPSYQKKHRRKKRTLVLEIE
jgi:hypothetical protein